MSPRARRARQGVLAVVKIDDVWYSSKRALDGYVESLRRS